MALKIHKKHLLFAAITGVILLLISEVCAGAVQACGPRATVQQLEQAVADRIQADQVLQTNIDNNWTNTYVTLCAKENHLYCIEQ